MNNILSTSTLKLYFIFSFVQRFPRRLSPILLKTETDVSLQLTDNSYIFIS